MAGAFSGHLLHTFNNGSAQPSAPTIVTSGAMSFDARAHGTPAPSPSFFSPSPMPHADFGFTPSDTTSKQIATLQAKLNKKLGPEYISQRPGPGGGPKLTYAEGWKIINLANEVFGFNGWSSSIVSITTDFVDYSEDSKRFNVGVTAIVRVTLRDGVYHEDVGYGMLENGKSKGAALDKCKKEAITDALKRTLRNFGNLLGNCLYDKSYTQEVVKIKVPPAKFDKSELYRRPEFQERGPDAPGSAPHGGQVVPAGSSSRREEPRIKVEHQLETPITYVPRHLRQEMVVAAQQAQAPTPTRVLATTPQRASTPGTIDAPTNRAPPSVATPKPSGLATPIQTPALVQRPPPPVSRAPPPRAVATSPLARAPSAPERGVSFAEPMPMQARASSADVADPAMNDVNQGHGQGNDESESEDAFPLSTQDDAFFATVDLGEGDLGRPIDFDEGIGGVSVMDESVLEPELDCVERPSVAPPQPEHQVRDGARSASSAGSSSGVPPKINGRNGAQERPAEKAPTSANAEPHASGSGMHPHPRSGAASASVSMSSSRSGPSVRTSAGGSHFSPGMKLAMQHTPKPVAPACVRTTSSTPQSGPANALKRSADVMQAGSGSGSGSLPRPPIQGMGLAQRQQQYQQQQNASSRRPSDTSEGNDPKRPKR